MVWYGYGLMGDWTTYGHIGDHAMIFVSCNSYRTGWFDLETWRNWRCPIYPCFNCQMVLKPHFGLAHRYAWISRHPSRAMVLRHNVPGHGHVHSELGSHWSREVPWRPNQSSFGCWKMMRDFRVTLPSSLRPMRHLAHEVGRANRKSPDVSAQKTHGFCIMVPLGSRIIC